MLFEETDVSMLNRVLLKAMLPLILLAGSPAIAHENHDKLGAGPGPTTEANVADQPLKSTAEGAPASQSTAEMHSEMAAAHGEAMEHHAEAAERNKTFGQRLMSWLGRAHSLVVHFPIAMFVGALGVELFGLWRRRRDYEWAAQVMLGVGAIGAVAAALLGWFAGGFYWTDRNPILMTHRWLGTGIAAVGLILLYLSSTAKRSPEKPRTIYWGVLGAMTVAIAIQGWLGGTFMHGGIHHMDF
jgi:uncharacterized membrane protein